MPGVLSGTGIVPGSGDIFNELTAITRRAFIPNMVVQIYKAAPLLSMAMRNAQRARGGLNQVTQPIQGASYVSFDWTGYDGSFQQPQVNAAAQNAAWNLCMGVVPIPLLGNESILQSTEAVIPRIRAVMTDAKTVAIQSIASAFFGSSGSNPLQINGLQDIYDNGTYAPSFGGVSRSANSFWQGNVYSSSLAPSRSTMIARIMQLTSLSGGESPDFVVMSLGDWTTLAADFLSNERWNTDPGSRYGNDEAVNSGFRAIMLGNTPILADPFCPAGTAYLINTRYLSMFLSEDANFAFSGFHSLIPNNQIASVGVMISLMSLVCSKPKSGMALTNVTGAAF